MALLPTILSCGIIEPTLNQETFSDLFGVINYFEQFEDCIDRIKSFINSGIDKEIYECEEELMKKKLRKSSTKGVI